MKNEFKISRIHYGGGGDWYADPSSIHNLLKFVSKNTNIKTNEFDKNLVDHRSRKRDGKRSRNLNYPMIQN